MTVQSILGDTKIFLEHLGLAEEPFGVYYDDKKPQKDKSQCKGLGRRQLSQTRSKRGSGCAINVWHKARRIFAAAINVLDSYLSLAQLSELS